MAYWVKIIGTTEEYWCGIQHKEQDATLVQSHHQHFVVYGDQAAYEERYVQINE